MVGWEEKEEKRKKSVNILFGWLVNGECNSE
jgi:hypothetical protein